jgi:hypothetical protein
VEHGGSLLVGVDEVDIEGGLLLGDALPLRLAVEVLALNRDALLEEQLVELLLAAALLRDHLRLAGGLLEEHCRDVP